MITREADYAIRAVLHLAREYDSEQFISTSDLATAMDIPYRFLRKIVKKLVTGNLVHSQRGKRGGLRLTSEPDQISLLSVMRAIDPNGARLNTCLTENPLCPRNTFCTVHRELMIIQKDIDLRLADITMDKLES
jgi:Rrf2 family protein